MQTKQHVQNIFFSPQNSYVITFTNSQNNYNQKGWYISIEKEKRNIVKKRTTSTGYVYLQKPQYQIMNSNVKWKFIQTGEENVYKIIVSDGQFKDNQLYCFQDMNDDFRDKYPSYFLFVAHQNYNQKYNKWKFQKVADNLFIIKNKDNNLYLSCHRYYQKGNNKDVRSSSSTWMIGHPQVKTLATWNIVPF